jgi:hypothetical protein
MLLDGIGLPRYWAAVWSTMLSSELAASTHTKKLRYLENLYQHAAGLGVGPNALDDALGTLDDEALADILESWFVSIRNQPVVTGGRREALADRSRIRIVRGRVDLEE